YDVVMARHLRTLVRGKLIRRAKAESASMEVHHDGAAAGEARRPNVQLEHIFTHVTIVPVLQERLLYCGVVVKILGAIGAIDQRRIFIFPRLGRLRRQPPVFSAGVLSIWNALEGEHASIDVAPYFAVLRAGDGRARRCAVSGLLVRKGFGAVERMPWLA